MCKYFYFIFAIQMLRWCSNQTINILLKHIEVKKFVTRSTDVTNNRLKKF